MLAVLGLALHLIRRLGVSAQAFTQTVREVEDGRLQARLLVKRPAEVAQVADESNEMLDVRSQTEMTPRDSEARLRLIVNQFPVMLWTTDRDLVITSNLGKGFQVVNQPPNALVTRSLYDIFNTTDPKFPAIQGHFQALVGHSTVFELDWADRAYECHIEALRDEHGQIIGCIGVAMEITERKQAENALHKREELFRAMIENSSDGLVLVSREGRITYASPGAARLSGFTTEEISSMDRTAFLHPDELEQMNQRWTTILQQPGAIMRGEYRVRHRDGSWRWVERVSHNLLEDPSVRAVVVNHRNITERKQAEEALRQYTTRLEIRHEIDEAILVAQSLESIAMEVLKRVTGLIPSQEAHILLVDFEQGDLTVFARVPTIAPDFIRDAHFSLDEFGDLSNLLDRLRREDVIVTDNLAEMLPNVPSIQKWLANGPRTVIVAPLREHGNLIGTFSLSAEGSVHYRPQEIEMVRELANSLAVVIVQKRLFEAVSAARDRLRNLSQQLIEVQEDVGRRIARELHDQIGANLTTLGINLNVLQDQLSASEGKDTEARLADSLDLLEETADRIRDVITDLHPAVLDDYGLEAGLRWYAGDFAQRTGLNMSVQMVPLAPRLPPKSELVLFRIVQEALTNTAKHAHATHAWIKLENLDSTIRLTIADDGTGFDPLEQRKPGEHTGLGLISMEERAESCGGHLRVESRPGQGTRIIAEIPV